MSSDEITDPVERIVASALDAAGAVYIRDGQGGTRGLDFYIPDLDLYIECKRFHTERSNEQLSRADNIILIQGLPAAFAFRDLIG